MFANNSFDHVIVKFKDKVEDKSEEIDFED